MKFNYHYQQQQRGWLMRATKAYNLFSWPLGISQPLNWINLHAMTQRGSRGNKARGQGQVQGQPFRGQTLSRPRIGMLEAKVKDQGH